MRATILGVTLLLACSGAHPPGSSPDGGLVMGQPVTTTLGATQQAEVDRIEGRVAAVATVTADDLLARRKVPFRESLGYDPRAAINLDVIQASMIPLGEAELAALGRDGFVISDRRRYPHFAYGYETIYSQHLPVYVSADSILEAVHDSYDEILKALELASLLPEMEALLAGMRTRLPAGLTGTALHDANLFLTVAASLLGDKQLAPRAGASAEVKSLFDKARAASGTAGLTLFGLDREVDFSQFKPRGHYNDSPELQRYFRGVMWLGRIDLPFIQSDGQRTVLVRRSVEAAVALRSLMDEAALSRWKSIDEVVRAFVGEPDSMGPPEVDTLLADLKVTDLAGVSDDALAAAIIKGGYGKQRILSQIVKTPLHEGTLPLDATFLFFGQRYVFDSHVFSNVVYDRANHQGQPKRMMPDPLDVAYAALGNDQAVGLLAEDLRRHGHAPDLEKMRLLADEHGDAFWSANLYNLWLSALRALSPTEVSDAASGLPAVATTEAWGRRILNTQLASWAELRHDTILYAKQSYTSGVACEFPDAYVEPYPAFFARLQAFARSGAAIAARLPSAGLTDSVRTYFTRLETITGTLREMAEHQRTGLPHTPEHLAFINDAVKTSVIGCGGPATFTGWYRQLYFDASTVAKFNAVVADVHTQPTDEAGTDVGNVLHVGTGWIRHAAVTVNTCAGPRVYVGPVSSYHQVVKGKYTRMTDEEWRAQFNSQSSPPDVPWMQGLVVK